MFGTGRVAVKGSQRRARLCLSLAVAFGVTHLRRIFPVCEGLPALQEAFTTMHEFNNHSSGSVLPHHRLAVYRKAFTAAVAYPTSLLKTATGLFTNGRAIPTAGTLAFNDAVGHFELVRRCRN